MRARLLIVIITLVSTGHPVVRADDVKRGDLILIQGAAGEEEYGRLFNEWRDRWRDAAARGHWNFIPITPSADDLEQKQVVLQQIGALQHDGSAPLWIVMIGHGTFDGRLAKFNLSGPDLTAAEMDAELAEVSRTTIVINCSSSSAPFLEQLSRDNRILITATRSSEQINFSRFGDFLSQAIGRVEADLDKDQQTSLLEAFLSASRKTQEFYQADGRLPTENALLDDNGDGKGTRSTAFQGVRVIATPEETGILLDGFRLHQIHLIPSSRDQQLTAEQLAQRNELERKIEQHRLRKSSLTEKDYYDQLEVLLLELAAVVLDPEGGSSVALPKIPPPAPTKNN